MAFRTASTLVKTPAIGLVLAPIKFKVSNTTAGAACTILAGAEFVKSITLQGNATNNANVATITLNNSVIDLVGTFSELEDNGATNTQTGNYVTVGNPLNLGTTSNMTVQVGFFAAAGSSSAFPINTIVYVSLVARNVSVTTGN